MYVDKIKPQCISCLIEKHLNSAPLHFSENEKAKYMQGILKILSEADTSMSAPLIVEQINKFKESLGIVSDYSGAKSRFNAYMLSHEAEIEGKIKASRDPLKTATMYAIAGNYIDFGALSKVEPQKLDDILGNAEKISLNSSEFEDFRNEIMSAQRIVYLTDNCGEIVLDKLLIKQILESNPNTALNVIVRGKDILNDCTENDAEQTGLCALVPVVGNGTAIAGTCLERISDEAKRLIDSADIIISKGQGNFETLYCCGKNIYYLFLCKCKMFAERFNVKPFTAMFLKEKDL